MVTPIRPVDEAQRLAAVQDSGLLDTPIEERFERITRMARRSFKVPIAAITLVEENRQWFKSAQGLDVNETSREVSFCGHAILGDQVMVVPDAGTDPRFSDNPLVLADPTIRFYAGCPVRGPDGSKLGTLCLIDRVPRELDADDLAALRDLASLVEDEFRRKTASATQAALVAELGRERLRAAIDPLTRIWNRGAILELLAREHAQMARAQSALALVFIDFDHFKSINDTYGHPAGDAVLREGASRLGSALRPRDALGRYGGEELVAVVPDCSRDEAAAVAERLRVSVDGSPFDTAAGVLDVTVSVGVGWAPPGALPTPERITEAADAALYRAKKSGRNRVEFSVLD